MAVLTSAVAAGVSAMFAVTLLRRWWERGRANQALLLWGVALVMFCVASVALLSGVVGGWTATAFTVFYLFGGVLNVPWLALGSIAVNASRPVVSRLTGGILVVAAVVVARQVVVAEEPWLWIPSAVLAAVLGVVLLVGFERFVVTAAVVVVGAFSALAAYVVVTAGFVAALPATGLPEGAELFAPHVRGLAVAGNSVGALAVVASALVSSAAVVWRPPRGRASPGAAPAGSGGGYVGAVARWVFRGRTGHGPALAHLVRGNLMIALGVGIAAAGGVLSFLGDTVGHAIGFTLGVVVMYAGFVRTTRPLNRPDRADGEA